MGQQGLGARARARAPSHLLQQGLGARARPRARVCSWMLSMVTVPSPSLVPPCLLLGW